MKKTLRARADAVGLLSEEDRSAVADESELSTTLVAELDK
jgi:hypothetical protein